MARTLKIPSGQRVALFGRTGSGKTTLAKRLLLLQTRWVVLDPKLDFRLDWTYPKRNSKAGETISTPVPITAAFNADLPRQIIRVEQDKHELARWDEAIDEIVADKNRVLYIDELTLINRSPYLRPSVGRAIRTGRSLGVGVWIGSQRPKDIPSAAFTEMEHFFVFQLGWDKDRDKVGQFTSDAMRRAIETLSGHDFVYYNVLSHKGFKGIQR